MEGDEIAGMEVPSFPPGPAIDFAILADAVQASGGKIYVLGGGWDTLFVRGFPATVPSLGVGLRVRVPWSDAGRRFSLLVDLVDEDGQSVLPSPLRHILVLQRTGTMPEGSDLGAVRAFTFNNVPLPKAGGYAFSIGIEGAEQTRLRFTVRERPKGKEA